MFLSGLGTYRRCHYAIIAEEAQVASFQQRLDAAMEFEHKRDKEVRETLDVEESPKEVERVDSVERKELGEAIREQNTRVELEKSMTNRMCNFGPSFDLPFTESD